jgi:chromosome segregation ATPase
MAKILRLLVLHCDESGTPITCRARFDKVVTDGIDTVRMALDEEALDPTDKKVTKALGDLAPAQAAKIDQLQLRIDGLQTDKDDLQAKVDGLQADKRSLNTDKDSLQAQVLDLQAQVGSLQDEIATLTAASAGVTK